MKRFEFPRKLVGGILGLVSFIGVIIIIVATSNLLSQLFRLGYVPDTDPLINLWIVLPTLLAIYLTIKIWRDKQFYDEYKTTFDIAVWGTIISLLLAIGLLGYLMLSNADGLAVLAVAFILIAGVVITFVAAFIALIIKTRSFLKPTKIKILSTIILFILLILLVIISNNTHINGTSEEFKVRQTVYNRISPNPGLTDSIGLGTLIFQYIISLFVLIPLYFVVSVIGLIIGRKK